MPKSIRSALTGQGLLKLYNASPAYQQNDYLGWISRAKLEETKEKTIKSNVQELKTRGPIYGNARGDLKWIIFPKIFKIF